VEAAQRFLGAKRSAFRWARRTGHGPLQWSFNLLMHEACAEVAKPDVVERRGAQGAVGEGTL
jgi:hypothetical protein